MRYLLIAAIILLGLFVIALTVIVWRLLAKRTQVVKRFGAVEVQLKRRHQLVEALSDLGKSKTERFDETLENLTLLNTQARQAGSPQEREHFENALSTSLGRLMVAAKGHDEYRRCPRYCGLLNELRQVENDLRRSTNFYNDVVDKFNAAVDRVPARLVAPLFSIGVQPQVRFDFAQAKSELLQPHLPAEAGKSAESPAAPRSSAQRAG